MQHAATHPAANAMLSDPNYFGAPVPVSDEQADRDLAAWKVGRTVRMILAGCPDGECIDNPEQLFDDIDALMPDLDGALRHQAVVLQSMCINLTMTRAGA